VFPTGYGPIRLAPSGKLGDPEVCSSVPPSSVRRIRLSVMWRTLQAIQLSPYHAGLAGLRCLRLLCASCFAAMLWSLLPVSAPVRRLTFGTFLRFPTRFSGIRFALSRRTARHERTLEAVSSRPMLGGVSRVTDRAPRSGFGSIDHYRSNNSKAKKDWAWAPGRPSPTLGALRS
jgi:hypothetical protein